MSKAGNLQKLKNLGMNVPKFQVFSHDDIQAGASLNLNLESGKYYAVRSSSSVEDGSKDSFAGIFETKLFVKENLEEAIREVWNSLYAEKSLAYCRQRNIPTTNLRMDVVIQEMIDADKAGVCFQANPLGPIHEQVIVAGFGAGQGIVDEITDTDRYLIDGYEIKSAEISIKKFCLRFNGSSLVKTNVSSEMQTASVLSQQEIEKILAASVRMSSGFEEFLDIEFCFKNGELFILQARPITTLPSKKHIQIFDNSNIAENYPGLSLPLTYSGLARAYAANFKNLIRFIGFRDEDWEHINNQLDQLVGYWGGQIYYNLNNWYSAYTLLPFGAEKAVKSFNEMVGINSDSIIQVPERSFLTRMRILGRILPKLGSFFFFGRKYHLHYKKQFKNLHRKYSLLLDKDNETFELIKLIQQVDNDYLKIIKIPLFNDFYSSLLNFSCRKLSNKLLPDGESAYNDLLSSKENLESSKAIYSLLELAQIVKEDFELYKYLKESPIPNEKHSKFFNKLKEHFDRYGDRSQWEMKIEVPTARENPEITIRLILQYATDDFSPEKQRQKEREKSGAARKKFRTQKFKKPIRYALFRMLFRKCSAALAFREDSRFDRVRFKGLSRKILLKLGQKLVEAKMIEISEDIFYFTFEELTGFIHDSYGPNYWKELVALRKRHLSRYIDLRLPDRILANDVMSVEKFAINRSASHEDKVTGIPCSGGIVEAPCEVVTDLHQAPSLAGKILVAERTDPAWGYFFVGVKGIIIEKGSMLSHAAIISRELGIPCIINVKNATQLFKSGMTVRMNGDTGEINLSQDK